MGDDSDKKDKDKSPGKDNMKSPGKDNMKSPGNEDKSSEKDQVKSQDEGTSTTQKGEDNKASTSMGLRTRSKKTKKKKSPTKVDKGKDPIKPRKDGVTKKRSNDAPVSFILPIIDGMFPPGMMGEEPPSSQPKRCRDTFPNPSKEKYNKSHSEYYYSLSKQERKRIADMEVSLCKANKTQNQPLRFRILDSGMSEKTKLLILQKASPLLESDSYCNEKPKIQKWVDIVMKIPFGITLPPPVTRDSPIQEIKNYISNTEDLLDNEVYGHREAKSQIIQTLAKWISNPSSKGNVIGLHGPAGCGKTTLVKHVGQALGTPTVIIPLGGASDASFLDGHSYVYEGSLPGIIVSSITRAGCMNPVILFDELDKVSQSTKGNEIINVLIHLTDPTQNDNFRDKYLGDVGMDLSKAIFVFTYNDINLVHPVLLDRMLRIETKEYSFFDKYNIATKFLLPKICQEHGFEQDRFKISETVLGDLISRIDQESGVRNMNRALHSIVSQFNFDSLIGNISIDGMVEITRDMVATSVKRRCVNASVNHIYM